LALFALASKTLYLLVFDSVPQFPSPNRMAPFPVYGALNAPWATFLPLLPARANPKVARRNKQKHVRG
jgi:hypothetical protein